MNASDAEKIAAEAVKPQRAARQPDKWSWYADGVEIQGAGEATITQFTLRIAVVPLHWVDWLQNRGRRKDLPTVESRPKDPLGFHVSAGRLCRAEGP